MQVFGVAQADPRIQKHIGLGHSFGGATLYPHTQTPVTASSAPLSLISLTLTHTADTH